MSLYSPRILELAAEVVTKARVKGWKIATAESCTGGLLAGALTEIHGSSDVFERGFVTYSNEAKTELLGVPSGLIASHGAVSEEVARAMAQGALARAKVNAAVSVTGIAGPGGGTDVKPVGLVHIGGASLARVSHLECRFGDIGRSAVRMASIEAALNHLLQLL
jgi:nicotinamide-nucleotide amidase